MAHTRVERQMEQSTLGKYSQVVSPELHQCENILSCVIEGLDKDRLFFRFTNLDPSEPQKEFTFVLDLSGQTYRGRFFQERL
jgi:kinetochore protein Spc25